MFKQIIFSGILTAFIFGAAMPVRAEDAKPQPPASLREKAEKGDTDAQREMGLFYMGQGQDWSIAREWFLKAAEKGDTVSERHAGRHLMNSWGYPGDPDKAIDLLKRAADKGDVEAQRSLGFAYLEGKQQNPCGYLLEKDPAKAFTWFEKAAAQNDPVALYQLGQLHFRASGVPLDVEKGRGLILKAAEAGNAEAQSWVAGELQKDPAKAFPWLEKAAAQGDIPAVLELGIAYLYGEGVAKDPKKAVELFRKAEAVEFPQDMNETLYSIAAQVYLGYIFKEGLAGAKDPSQAAEWFTRAVSLGSQEAQYQLAQAYEKGEGVGKDLRQAYKWYMVLPFAPEDISYYRWRDGQHENFASLEKFGEELAKTMTPAELAEAKRLVSDEERLRAQRASLFP